MKFRKKSVVIEAVLCQDAIRAASKDWAGLPEWLSNAYEQGRIVLTESGLDIIPSAEYTLHARPTDWLIHGEQGVIVPYKPDAFATTYERVEEVDA